MTHTLLLDDAQKFTFQKTGEFVTVTRARRAAWNVRQWEFTGTFTWGLEEGRRFWTRLVKDGAVRS